MATKVIDDAVSMLEKERERLLSELTEVKAREGELLVELTQIEEGVAALSSKPIKKTAGSRKKRSPGKPSPTRKDVVEAISALLANGENFTEDELKPKVEEIITSQGKSKMGLSLRFTEALSEPEFANDGGSYSLAELADSTAPARPR